MLVDDGDVGRSAGALDENLHLPSEWLNQLIALIIDALPAWRDDPSRPTRTSEAGLTAQLCGRLASLTRRTPGWDFLQFRREEPDESDARRSIDLVVAPAGAVIWIEGRAHTEYETLLPIECKRLPTPRGTDRDEREYLFSAIRSTGGVQRFKAGHHGSATQRAAMIGYVQDRDIAKWLDQVGRWIDELEASSIEGWSKADKLTISLHDQLRRSALLRSTHARRMGLDAIRIDHMWIEL